MLYRYTQICWCTVEFALKLSLIEWCLMFHIRAMLDFPQHFPFLYYIEDRLYIDILILFWPLDYTFLSYIVTFLYMRMSCFDSKTSLYTRMSCFDSKTSNIVKTFKHIIYINKIKVRITSLLVAIILGFTIAGTDIVVCK